MLNSKKQAFGAWRSFFWPVHKHECRKVIPMFFMLLLICFNYTLLKNMKDALIITASGAEVIPFIKVWCMLPAAVVATALFTRLSRFLTQERVFYLITFGFLLFFALFALVLYPNRDTLHPSSIPTWLSDHLPQGLQGMVGMVQHWTLTAFYVFSELWGCLVLMVMFWGFANEHTPIEGARRYYGVLTIGSNIASVAAGQMSVYLSKNSFSSFGYFPSHTEWEHTLLFFTLIISLSTLVILFLFRYLNKQLPTQDTYQPKKKTKLSLKESLSFLAKSPYLLYIALIVVSYNLVINVVEVIWKDQLKTLYPLASDYNCVLGYLTSSIGIVSTLGAFFIPYLIKKWGWTKTALIAPGVMLITSSAFFFFLFFQDGLTPLTLSLTATTPFILAVIIGASQNCLSKAAKYSILDATKEIAFIPLSSKDKLQGKAAIDGVGSRLGKSGGSLFHQGLLMIFGTVGASIHLAAIAVFSIIGVWIFAVKRLGSEFDTLAESKEEKVYEEPLLEVKTA